MYIHVGGFSGGGFPGFIAGLEIGLFFLYFS